MKFDELPMFSTFHMMMPCGNPGPLLLRKMHKFSADSTGSLCNAMGVENGYPYAIHGYADVIPVEQEKTQIALLFRDDVLILASLDVNKVVRRFNEASCTDGHNYKLIKRDLDED